MAFFVDRVSQALVRDAHQLLGADLVLVVRPAVASRGLERYREARSAKRGRAELHQHGVCRRAQPPRRRQGGDARTIRCAAACASRRRPARRTRRRRAGPQKGTVWLDEQLVSALGAPVGSRVRLGRAELNVAAVLTLEPERSANFFNIAPRLMMNTEDVPATSLVQTGSRVWYYLYAAGAPERVRSFEEFLKPRLERGQRIETLETGRPAGARLGRARRALPRPHGAARRDARRRGDRARHAALRRAPSRRLRGDALPGCDAAPARHAVRPGVHAARRRGLRRGRARRPCRAAGDRRGARRAAARRAAAAERGARRAGLPRRPGAAAGLRPAAAPAAEERAGGARHPARNGL